MADHKQDQQPPVKAGDRQAFGAGVSSDPGKADSGNVAYPNPAKPDQMVPGGAFIRGVGEDAVVIDSNGDVRNDMEVGKDKDGNPVIVPKAVKPDGAAK